MMTRVSSPFHSNVHQVWATCLGLEWLLQALGGQDFALDTALDAWNVSLPLEYTSEAAEVRC